MKLTPHMTKNIGADNAKQQTTNGLHNASGVVQGAYHASFTSGGGGTDCPLQNEYESVLEEV